MNKKRYPINQSPLYKIKGIGQLKNILQINQNVLDRILTGNYYNVFHNTNGREIQHPYGTLAIIHKRISSLLKRIEHPDYLFSQAGKSYILNAAKHLGNHPVVKTDISSFFRKTTYKMIQKMFYETFRCAYDISKILAKICCYKEKHLPTGSPLSTEIAFFASKRMFDKINNLSKERSITTTVYVDDITCSGKHANKKFIYNIIKIIKSHGFDAKPSKTKTFPADKNKTVTGIIISGNNLLPTNSRHKKIYDTRKALKKEKDKQRLKKSLLGQLNEIRSISKVNESIKENRDFINKNFCVPTSTSQKSGNPSGKW